MDCASRRSQTPRRTPDRGSQRHWPQLWMRRWILGSTLVSGALALIWLLLRSGPRPSRLTYPCQQAASATAAAAFGVPLIAALLATRTRLVTLAGTLYGRIVIGGFGALVLAVFVFATGEPASTVNLLPPPPGYHPQVFVVSGARGIEPGRYGGIDDLVTLMGLKGFAWYRSDGGGPTTGPGGLIDADDVVLIKVNGQWSQRGGTNTDVLRGIIRRIVEHPDGFIGEIVVADNGQRSGNLDRTESNAEDHQQSIQDVVDDFAAEGFNISTYLWDSIRSESVGEYFDGDSTSGYVVTPDYDPETLIKVSYPKFQTSLGTYVSYKYGIWSPSSQSFDGDKLVVLNVPVLKTHRIYAVTASVKNHMGVITTDLDTDSHEGVDRGGMGSVLAEVRLPDLSILDCIWVLARPGSGPDASYESASRRDQLVASTDPVALDMWAAKNILVPQIIENGYSYSTYHNTQDPDNPESKFRTYLDRSMNELLLAGIETTNDLTAIDLHVWYGDLSRDGDVDTADYVDLAWCLSGPDGMVEEGCEAADREPDDDIDLADIAEFQRAFTGPLD